MGSKVALCSEPKDIRSLGLVASSSHLDKLKTRHHHFDNNTEMGLVWAMSPCLGHDNYSKMRSDMLIVSLFSLKGSGG